MTSSTTTYSEIIFDYLVGSPSSTAAEVAIGLDFDVQQCRGIINDLWKRGKLERALTPTPAGNRKNTYRYWTTEDKLTRAKTGRRPKQETFEIPEGWSAKPALKDRLPEPVQQFVQQPVQHKDRGLEDLMNRINKTPPPEKNAANTVYHEVTINISAHPVILMVLEKLSKHL
jgi:hypothetical protein